MLYSVVKEEEMEGVTSAVKEKSRWRWRGFSFLMCSKREIP
jgi:hypothetical protein